MGQWQGHRHRRCSLHVKCCATRGRQVKHKDGSTLFANEFEDRYVLMDGQHGRYWRKAWKS